MNIEFTMLSECCRYVHTCMTLCVCVVTSSATDSTVTCLSHSTYMLVICIAYVVSSRDTQYID